jgi:hypothetical protein
MLLDRSIAEYPSVKTWDEGLRQHWGGEPLKEDPSMAKALEEFCAFVDEDPDTIVSKLFRIRKSDGERVLSVKWRQHYADKIKEFRAQVPGMEGQRRGSSVLSFMIHNGVLIQV